MRTIANHHRLLPGRSPTQPRRRLPESEKDGQEGNEWRAAQSSSKQLEAARSKRIAWPQAERRWAHDPMSSACAGEP
jgi:hypothetical protein